MKAHGHTISICMINLRGDSLYKPLKIIFVSCLNLEIFTAEWKKVNAMVVYKKRDHMLKNTDRYPFFQCLVKCLKDSFITLCSNNF